MHFDKTTFKNLLKKLPRILFWISQLYWIWGIGSCIASYWLGSGMEYGSFFAGYMLYGIEGMRDAWSWFVMTTVLFFWWIPVYQVVYLLVILVKKMKKNRKPR